MSISPTSTTGEEWRRSWPTVLVTAFGMSATVMYIYSAGVFVGPIQTATGWSRAQIGSGISVANIMAVLVSPLVGAAVDRYGARRLAILAFALQPVAFGGIALTGSTIQSWWLQWALLGLLGCAMSPATWTAAITKLFDNSRGLALAVTMSGMGLGSLAIPIASTILIQHFGWRAAFPCLALIWGSIGLPLVLFVMRDGHTGPLPRPAAGAQDPPSGARLRSLLLSRGYLTLLCASLFFSFVAMSFVMSIVPILIWQGVDATRAAAMASMLGLAAIVGRLSTGFLLDRLDARLVTATAVSLPVIAGSLLWAMPGSIPVAGAAILIMGLSLGAEVDAIAYLVSRYFGTRNYALLFGISVSITSVATAIAPIVSGLIYDATGGYTLLFLIIICPCVISAAAILTLGHPPTEATRSAAERVAAAA